VPPLESGALASDGHPLAGWHNGLFFLRDYHDNFRLYLQGRLQIDSVMYFGPGVPESSLKDTVFLRTVRVELTGEFLKYFNWALTGDWGRTGVDNPSGTNETSAAAPGAAPSAASARYTSAQTASIKAAPSDVFVNFRPWPFLNFQLGQYDAPFTMENRTSSKYYAFMENSLAVRDLGEPNGKEIGLMAWGETPGRYFGYCVGPFLGNGQNRPNLDNNLDLFGRLFVHPFATSIDGELKNLQLGASLHTGVRDTSVNYDAPAMTTQGNYTFWSPTYTSSRGLAHVIPSAKQLGVAAELRVPFQWFDISGEFVYSNNGTREALDGYQSTNTERYGDMTGYAYYLQLGVWPLGNRDLNGLPGYENPPHVNFSKADEPEPRHALQLLAKWEQLNVKYSSASVSGVPDPQNIDGSIKVNAFSLGANYWFTKHVRLTANYIANFFPDAAPVKPTSAGAPAQTSDQRAIAPGNTLKVGIDDSARNTANNLHELMFRVAIAL
jgi:hypothetical protein